MSIRKLNLEDPASIWSGPAMTMMREIARNRKDIIEAAAPGGRFEEEYKAIVEMITAGRDPQWHVALAMLVAQEVIKQAVNIMEVIPDPPAVRQVDLEDPRSIFSKEVTRLYMVLERSMEKRGLKEPILSEACRTGQGWLARYNDEEGGKERAVLEAIISLHLILRDGVDLLEIDTTRNAN